MDPGGKRGEMEEEETKQDTSPKGLRCFSDHLSPPTPPPGTSGCSSFFCSVALKSSGMSFPSLGSALEWELALGPAFGACVQALAALAQLKGSLRGG